MHKLFFILIFFFTNFFVCFSVGAKEPSDYQFRTLSPEGGYYYDGINSIKQDKDGFIWVLMKNDLYRFDGYQHKRYYSRFKGLNTTKSWYFNSIAIDSVGHIFISSENGVFLYDKATDSFEKSLNTAPSLKVIIDNNDNLWLRNYRNLSIYDRKKNNLNPIGYKGKPINNNSDFSPTQQGLFVGTSDGKLLIYDNKNSQFKFYLSFPTDFVIQGVIARKEKLWVLTANSGLYKVDFKSKKIEKQYDFFCQDENEKITANMFICDKNDNILIATQRGLFVFNPDNEKYFKYEHSKSDPYSIPNNSVWVISEDNHRNLWIGTYSGGLAYVDFNQNTGFKSYTFSEKELSHNVVSAFAEDSKAIWIGTEGGGLNRMDKQNGTFSCLKHNFTPNSPASNHVKSMVIDSKNQLWLAMFKGGLDCYDLPHDRFQHFRYETGNNNSLKNDNLRKIVLEGDTGLWIAYQQKSLVISYYSFKLKKFTHYSFSKSEDNFIFDLVRGHNNDLWIASHKRLYRMDVKKRAVEAVPLNDLPALNAQSIYVDTENNVWIGSVGNGLIKFDTRKSKYFFFDEILKFNITAIYSICSDGNNKLWIGTDNGLFQYSIPINQFARYDKKDGVQGPVFYPLASMKSENGDIYFGGTNGFTIVYPDKLIQNSIKPKAIISDFLIDNVSVKSDAPNSPLKSRNDLNYEIKLSHNQVNFGFTFSSDNYLIPEKNRFKYRLRGYDDNWKEVDATNRNAYFYKVPPGSYVFEVTTANNDGIWSEHPTTINVKRLPAPWLSLPAYLLYFILIGLIFYTIWKYNERQKKLKMELYLENLEKIKKEEIHQSQLRFFTNVSHDFRTPLSLILATLNKMKQDGLDNQHTNLLNNSAQRLYNLVNELMDFRTIENGKMKLKIAPNNINQLINEFSFDFIEYAKQRNINFSIHCDPDLDTTIYLDRKTIEKIVVNLLDNAFKYTHDGGMISITTYYSLSEIKYNYQNCFTISNQTNTDNYFCIAIEDTGIGISQTSISKVFERFYKNENTDKNPHLGIGIGLALVKSLVLLHKGLITVSSEKGKGTNFTVAFSRHKEMYDFDDFATDNNIVPATITPYNSEMTYSATEKPKIPADYMDEVLLREKKRVLLVEDNTDLRRVIAGYLNSYYEMVEAENGEEATKIIDKMEINLIVSDIIMPVKDGVTLCKEVKSDINTSHIPVFLLTAKSGLESKIEGTASGADMYFEKPVDLHLLNLSIQNIFIRQQNLKEHYAKNYFVDSSELSNNQQDNAFLKKLGEIIELKIDETEMDVNYIAAELSMSRSKLYTKLKSMTDKSIVEFILSYRLRKAAQLIAEENLSMREVMEKIGIESQSYFTSSFKKEFGETPTGFARTHRK